MLNAVKKSSFDTALQLKVIKHAEHHSNRVVAIINPRRSCAARVTVVIFAILSVCLLPRFLPLRATRRPISDTNGFSATLALFLKWRFFVKMLRWKVMV